MTAPIRPSLDDIVQQHAERPSLDAIVASATPRADGKPAGFRTPEQIARLNKADVEGAADEMASDEATTRGKVLGTLAAPLSEVPGGSAVQAYAAGGPQGFRGGANAVKDAIASAPATARIPAKLLGGVASTALLPSSLGIGAQGALLGGAGEALSPEDEGFGKRAGRTAGGAAVGGALGMLGDLAMTGGRAIASKTLGSNALARRATMRAADATNYGAAEREGAGAVAAERGAKADAQQAIDRTNEIVNRKALPAPGQSEVAKAALPADLAEEIRIAKMGSQGQPSGDVPADLPRTLEQATSDNYTNVTPPTEPLQHPHGGGQFTIQDYTKPRPVEMRSSQEQLISPKSEFSPLYDARRDRLALQNELQIAPTQPGVPPLPNPLTSVRRALQEPDIAPYVQEVMGSRTMQGADEPAILREVYRRMSERQGDLARSLETRPAISRSSENRDIGASKDALLNAADDVMPSFRGAVQMHAQHAGELDALREGADATQRIVRGKSVAGKNLETKSPEGFLERLQAMKPGQQEAAREGILGRTKEQLHLSPNPFSGFGTLTSAYRVGKATPLLRQADNATGRSSFLDALRSLTAAGAGVAGGP